MKRVAFAVLALAVCAARAGAQEPQPSFDCEKASNAAEREICRFEPLMMMDRALARIYPAARKSGGKAVSAAQRKWLKKRNACGGNRDCLMQAHVRRLVALGRAAGDAGGVSGEYHYRLKDNGWSSAGNLWLMREADGGLTGALETVTGRTAHTCEIEFERAVWQNGLWRWKFPDPTGDLEEACIVTITPLKGGVKVQGTPGCQDFCGASGFFSTVYRKVR